MTKTSNAIKIIDQLTSGNSELEAIVAEASINAEVAQLIYEANTLCQCSKKSLRLFISE
jgi:hypothetical protein